jgi:DNA-binding transcriptional ArsR family regulator
MEVRQIEKIVKGFSNHWRIRVVQLLHDEPGLTVDQLSEATDANFYTLSIHLTKMVNAGLVKKTYKGRNVQHELTPIGKKVFIFVQMFK